MLEQMACEDNHSFFQHAATLRPKETGKFFAKPGYQQMHHLIQHDIWVSILDCWYLEAKEQNAEWDSLEKFAESNQEWELIVEMSHEIVQKHVALGRRTRRETWLMRISFCAIVMS
jgi:hypothetical protein